MRIGVSALAWNPDQDDAAADLLRAHGIDAVDLIPARLRCAPEQVRRWWEARGIEITGMQALLHGAGDLRLFGPPVVQAALHDHFDAVCRLGAALGARRLVYGAPRSRDPAGLDPASARHRAAEFLGRVGAVAQAAGVIVCVEPVPPSYGGTFMTGSADTAQVIAETAHPAIRLQVDSGSMHLNGEPPGEVLPRIAPLAGHVHASEPGLVPLGTGGVDHAAMAAALRRHLPHSLVCIEMMAVAGDGKLEALARAIAVARQAYGAATAAPAQRSGAA